MANKGDWVQVHVTVLPPEERASGIPADTRTVPLEMWVKGILQNKSASMGETVCVTTRTGRTVEGVLCAISPSYTHSFGDCVPELLQIDDTVRGIVFGGASHA